MDRKRRFLRFARSSSEMHLGVTALAGYYLSPFLGAQACRGNIGSRSMPVSDSDATSGTDTPLGRASLGSSVGLGAEKEEV